MQMRAQAEAWVCFTLASALHGYVRECGRALRRHNTSEGIVRGVESTVRGFQALCINSAERDSTVQSRCYGDHHKRFEVDMLEKKKKNINVKDRRCAGMKGLCVMLWAKEHFGPL